MEKERIITLGVFVVDEPGWDLGEVGDFGRGLLGGTFGDNS